MRVLVPFIFMLGTICYGLGYDSTCTAVDPSDLSKGYIRLISNSSNYTVSFGYIPDLSVTPEYRMVVNFSDSNCTPTNVTQYTVREFHDPSKSNNINLHDRWFSFTSKGGLYSRVAYNHDTYQILSVKFFLESTERSLSINESATSGDPFDGNTLHQASNVKGQLFIGTDDSMCHVNYPDHPNGFSVSEHDSDAGCLVQLNAKDSAGDNHEFSFRLKIDNCTDFDNAQTSCMQTVPLMDSSGLTTNVVVQSNYFQYEFYNADTNEKL